MYDKTRVRRRFLAVRVGLALVAGGAGALAHLGWQNRPADCGTRVETVRWVADSGKDAPATLAILMELGVHAQDPSYGPSTKTRGWAVSPQGAIALREKAPGKYDALGVTATSQTGCEAVAARKVLRLLKGWAE